MLESIVSALHVQSEWFSLSGWPLVSVNALSVSKTFVKGISGLEIATDKVVIVTNIPSLVTKNSGLITISDYISVLTINNSSFLTHYVLLENRIERSLLLKHSIEEKSLHPFALLYWFSHIKKLPNSWMCLKSLYNALQNLDNNVHYVMYP